MNWILRPVIPFAAMATLALLNASCEGTISPTEALAESSREFAEVFSFQNRIESTSTGGGFTFSLEGTAAYAEDELKYMSMTIEGKGDGFTSKTETLLLPPDYYMKTPDGQWYVLGPWHQGTPPEEAPDMSFDEEFLDYERIVRNLEGVEQLADETTDGRTYMRFSGDMPFSDIDTESDVFGDVEGRFHVVLWVDSETKLPDRMSVTSEMSVAGNEVTGETTIRYIYNETIFVPLAPSDALPWSEREFEELPEVPDVPEAPCAGAGFKGCMAAQAALEPVSKPSCDGPGRRVCLAPMGQVDPTLVQQLVEYYRAEYGLEVTLLTPMDVPAADVSRQQLETNRMMNFCASRWPDAWDDPEAVVICLTPLDIYDSTTQWGYLYGVKAGYEDPKGVISTFRMNPESYGGQANPDLALTRTRKLLTKYIGLLYYGIPENYDPESPMFRSMYSLAALDGVQEPLIIPGVQW